MTTRQLTAPEALREVARRLAEAPRGSYLRAFPFLCNRVDDLRPDRFTGQPVLISEETRLRIRAHIRTHLEPGKITAYSDGPGMEVEARILAALWMAHELEEEDKEAARASA